jgi:hypothetical protein
VTIEDRILPNFPSLRHTSPVNFAWNIRHRKASRWRWIGLWPQLRDHPKDVSEQPSWDGDRGHLERDVTAVAHHFRADLDQLLLQARQRAVFDRLGRRQRAQEIAEIISQRMKLEADGVGVRTSGMIAAST